MLRGFHATEEVNGLKRMIYISGICLLLCAATIFTASCESMGRPENEAPQTEELLINLSRIDELPEDLTLVNAGNPLPEDFQPNALVNLYNQENRHFQLAKADIEVCETVFEAMNTMFAAAKREGITDFIITSGYRSREDQEEIFSAATDGVAAKPGESEHETGLAFDVVAMGDDNFELTPHFEWLSAHCAEYGFIIRYPKDREDVTGIPYEPWHYRYVGKEHAVRIMDKEITLEEYLRKR